MEYKLFNEFITLQALLKQEGIIQSGGAIKEYLNTHTVYLNGEEENRRGKKLRLGDQVELTNPKLTINLVEPSQEEIQEFQLDKEEKERVAALVKKMNQGVKKSQGNKMEKKKPVRFPGR